MEEDWYSLLRTTCCMCLSKDRELFLVQAVRYCLENFFLLSSFDSVTFNESFCMNSTDLHICWECEALMRRFSKFRRQVSLAHENLSLVLNKCLLTEEPMSPLSRLDVYYKNNYDLCLECQSEDDVDDDDDDDDNGDDNFIACGLADDAVPVALDADEHSGKNVGVVEEMAPRYDEKDLDSINVPPRNNKNKRTKAKTTKSLDDTNKGIGHIDERTDTNLRISKYITAANVNYEEMLQLREQKMQCDWYVTAAYKCESCVQGFKDKVELDKHALDVHTKRPDSRPCDTCKAYVNTSDFPHHTTSHYTKYTCGLCDRGHSDLVMAVDHLNTVHHIANIARKQAEVTLDVGLKSRRKKTLKDASSVSGLPCLECGKHFMNQNSKWKHIQKEHREGFACAYCGKKFAFKSTLDKHESLHQGPLPRQECGVCHKQIRTDLMRIHAMTHAPRQGYSCEECARSFASLATYEHHVKYARPHRVVDVHKYPCDMCEKGYRSRGELRDHVNYQHLNKTLHKCPVCDKALATRRCITRHMKRAHSGVTEARGKVCGRCGKSFRDQKGLVEHEMTHTGERPLSCELCGLTFRQRASLYTHRKRIHKIYPTKKVVQHVAAEQ